MRSYPRNSPQAAARIVALTMLADGYVGRVELEVLDQLGAAERLGLSRAELHTVVHAFCEDLLTGARNDWVDASRVDERTMLQMMAEIDDPALRLKLLQLCVQVVEADQYIAHGESAVLVAAIEQWGLHSTMLRPEPTMPA